MTPPDDLSIFYRSRSEQDRLHRGVGQLEAARTLELLACHLPPAPATIYDIGGGTGVYAAWLTQRGYTVHLLDPVAEHIDTARQHPAQLASAEIGDARSLPWPDQSADAVLLMGPLYHLSSRTDRIRALIEARRVMRDNGILFGVVIPRWASALIGMLRGWIYDDDYAAMVRREITSGRHLRPASWPQLFMDGFFHSIDDLTRETAEAGLNIQFTAAIEGAAWMCQDFEESWANPDKRERILEIARLAEQSPEIIAASPHVAFVARVG